jgi:curved DNA-binding protein
MDLADLLAGLHRAQRRGRPAAPVRGRDYEATIRVSLEDAHRGTTVSLDVEHEDGTHTLAVTVPPGAVDGQRLRLRGKGGPGRHGGEAGDIYLHISLLPHPVFRTVGHDLYFDLDLAPWEAALGADIEVPTLDGPVLLTVPPGSRTGRKLRLRGRGLAVGHGTRGDLYALVRVDVPAALGARERELFEELSRISRFNPRRIAGQETSHA